MAVVNILGKPKVEVKQANQVEGFSDPTKHKKCGYSNGMHKVKVAVAVSASLDSSCHIAIESATLICAVLG